MSLTLPSPRDEAWRWADLSSLPVLSDAQPTGGAAELPAPIGTGPRLVFVDGRLDAARSKVGSIEIGAIDVRSEHPLGRLATRDGWAMAGLRIMPSTLTPPAGAGAQAFA